jgi:pyruvate-ferredoxin/flavodoxin oxidoreductase
MGLFLTALGDFQFATTKPYWTNREKKARAAAASSASPSIPTPARAAWSASKVCEDDALAW